ncbi:MAG: ATP-dependent DNA helicase [Alphaproteobacteria bacterium]|nr:ATP-dependent DNA helicase [Alphaproteobacteria bacterium]
MTLQARKEPAPNKRLLIPQAPVLVMDGHRLFCLTLDGELKEMEQPEARLLVQQHMPIVCNGPRLAAHLHMKRFHAYDVLELFAFIHPGKFSVPTPRGLARALNLLEPATPEDQCLALRDCIRHLLVDLTAAGREEKSDPAALAAMMGLVGTVNLEQGGWPWTPTILSALNRRETPPSQAEIRAATRIWDKLPEWSIHAPEAPPSHYGVSTEEASERLHKLLYKLHKEDRPEQHQYAAALAEAFAPRDEADAPHAVLAEAGTGVGKTLGYLAPATVWAEKNGGPVWVSTFTRNLQRQVDSELDRLYDDPVTKSRKVVTRKGRENYLCLLNLEDAAQGSTILANDLNAAALGLMLRWAAVTEDGDLAGKDFPGWLTGLLGRGKVYSFADRRGECVYSACPHFHKCFIEKSVRKAKRADIVIANHALVMHQVAVNGKDNALPGHYIFDEGHHLFEAADNAFDFHLNGAETADLRRWLLGIESGQRSRARGIKRRIEDMLAGNDAAIKDLEDLIEAARGLPGPSWRQRLHDGNPKGVVESFLLLCRQQVQARNKEGNGFYSLETEVQPPVPGLFEASYALQLRLKDMKRPMESLVRHLQNMLADEADSLDSETRERIHFIISSLNLRAKGLVGVWIDMLESLKTKAPDECVDWLEITRLDGHEHDVGFYRHYVVPAKIFSSQLLPHAHGVVVTSATLRDASEEDPEGWRSALTRTGVKHLSEPKLFHVSSPFDYKNHTRVLIVGDVKKDEPGEVAAAYRELFLASGGGALGIFTSVQRLKAVHEKLLPPLENNGLHLYAQHVDQLDISTLIDIFREEENACLLGTDATRDGIDVPGRSLRLVVYDRVPWPKPTILHKARRGFFGKNYDDMLTRFKLKQAYGRLIRRADDRGVFVMLDGALPSRLLGAFPEGVTAERVGLKEAVEITRKFL